MGTSQSSKGAPSNVPMVPSWTPAPPGGLEVPKAPTEEDNPGKEPKEKPLENPKKLKPETSDLNPLAPRGRFNLSRRNISDFAKTGNRESLSRGLGNYSKKGLGGGKTAARRMAGTSKTAGALYQALSGLSSQIPGQTPVFDKLDKAQLEGRPVREIINRIVEALSPSNGTQDSEARKRSIDNALSDLLKKYPEADLCNLNEDQVEYSVEAFAVEDMLRRFELDLQQTIIENAPGIVEASKRAKEAKDFIKEVARESFRELKSKNGKLNQRNVNKIVNDAIEITFDVFGTYAK